MVKFEDTFSFPSTLIKKKKNNGTVHVKFVYILSKTTYVVEKKAE